MFYRYIFLLVCFTTTLALSEEVVSGIEEEHHHHSSSTTERNEKGDSEILSTFSMHYERVTHNLNDSHYFEILKNGALISVEQETIKDAERLFENEVKKSSIENEGKTEKENAEYSTITTEESVNSECGEHTGETKNEAEIHENETYLSLISEQDNEDEESLDSITITSGNESFISEFSLKDEVEFFSSENELQIQPESEIQAITSLEAAITEKVATEEQKNEGERTEKRNEIDITTHVSIAENFKSVENNVKIGTSEYSSEASESTSRHSIESSKESMETDTVEHSRTISREYNATLLDIETSQNIGSQKDDAEDYEAIERHTLHKCDIDNHSFGIINEDEVSTSATVERKISSKSHTKLRKTTLNANQTEHKRHTDKNNFLKSEVSENHTLELTPREEQTSKGPETGSNEEVNCSEFRLHNSCYKVTSIAESEESEHRENVEEYVFRSIEILRDSTTEIFDLSKVHSSTTEGCKEESEEVELSVSVKNNIDYISKSHLESDTDRYLDHGIQEFVQSFFDVTGETSESERVKEMSRKAYETFAISRNTTVPISPEDVEYSPASETSEIEKTMIKDITSNEASDRKESPVGKSAVQWSGRFSTKNLASSEIGKIQLNKKTLEKEFHYDGTIPNEALDKSSQRISSESLAIDETEKEQVSRVFSETEVSANETFTKSSEITSEDSSSIYNHSSIKVQKEAAEQIEQPYSPALSWGTISETGQKSTAKPLAFPVYQKKSRKSHIFKQILDLHSTVECVGFFLDLSSTPCKYCHHKHEGSTSRTSTSHASSNTEKHTTSERLTKIPESMKKHTRRPKNSPRTLLDGVLTTVKIETNFVGGGRTPCEYCKSSSKKPKISTQAIEITSKVGEKYTRKAESVTYRPNEFLTSLKIEKIFVGSGTIPGECCNSFKSLQDTENHTQKVDIGSLRERQSKVSELEAYKDTKNIEKQREREVTRELVETEESSESAGIEYETEFNGHSLDSHEELKESQKQKFEQRKSPITHSRKKPTENAQITHKTYGKENNIFETTRERQRKIETTHQTNLQLYRTSGTHELVTALSAIQPQNIVILIHNNEPLQNFNSYISKIDIKYKAMSGHEVDSISQTYYKPRVSESFPQRSMKRDFEAGIDCFCNISKYLYTLETRILNKEQIKSNNDYCESFFHIDLLKMKKSSNSRTRRTSIIDFENSMNQCEAELEFDSIDSVFKGDFTLPLKGEILYSLPSESVTIHCDNNFLKESTKTPTEEKLTIIWTFQPSSSRIAKELPRKDDKLVIHRISPKNAGTYTCSLTSKQSVMLESWHKLEVLNFPIYEIKLNIFYRINDSCNIQLGEHLKWHIPELISPLLCSGKRAICNLEIDNPRCLTRDKDNYYNITIRVTSNPDVVFLLQSECSINCKFSFYENLVHMVYKNAEVLEHTNISAFSEIGQMHEIMFAPYYSTNNGTTVTTKLPKLIVTCPAGYGLEATKQRVCVVCPRNTYSKKIHSFCKVCPEGKYQPDPGSESCIKCNSPVEAPICLRMLYTDTNLFNVYVGVILGFMTLLIIILIIWISGLKNRLHDDKICQGSLAHGTTNQLLSPDLERGYCECLPKTAPPQIPPIDF